MTNIELYEALKDALGTEAARMLADHIPPGTDIARSQDVDRLRLSMEERFQRVEDRLAALEGRFDGIEHLVRAEVASAQTSLVKFMWGFFVPLWLGMLGLVGTMTALVLKL